MQLRASFRFVLAGAVTAAVLLAAAMTGLGAPRAGATTPVGPTYYLALGGSASVGVQPTAAYPKGAPTDEGYANDLVAQARSIWPSIELAQLGCPGETTLTFINGGDRCHRDDPQLRDALVFLHAHPSTMLITLDLGFNDIRPCVEVPSVDQACLARALAQVQGNIEHIVAQLRMTASTGVRIVGVGHYDPDLGAWSRSHQFAVDSMRAVALLNKTLRDAYAAVRVPMADVASAFMTDVSRPSALSALGLVPKNVARVCALTWECAGPPFGPNQHPNDRGYALIAQAIMSVLRQG